MADVPLTLGSHTLSGISYSKSWLTQESEELLYNWHLTANQFVMALSLLWLMTRYFFNNWTLMVIILWNILSDNNMGLSLMNMLGLCQLYVSHIQHFIENSSLYKIDKSSISPMTGFSFQSYVMTDSQLASLSWCQAPIWGPRPDFCYCQAVAGLLMWGTISDERMGLLFAISAGPCPCWHSHSQVKVPWDSWLHFTASDLRLPPAWSARSPYLYLPSTGWPSYTPGHWVPFMSPPTLTDSH
jgi:hypothetical protein